MYTRTRKNPTEYIMLKVMHVYMQGARMSERANDLTQYMCRACVCCVYIYI